MAALIITSNQVLLGTGASSMARNAAVAVSAGQTVYLDANNNWALAQADGTPQEAAAGGIALNNAGPGQPVTVCTAGPLILGAGAAPAAGMIYCVGIGPGDIVPYGDLLPTNRVTLLGWGLGTNQIQVALAVTGVQKV